MTDVAQTPGLVRQVLHVGCGPARRDKLHARFRGPEWREVRLDINPDVEPDILGSMTDMSAVESGSMDALWSSHNVEHLYAHEVPVAFAEFLRVLKPGGVALVTCPDLQAVARIIAADRLEDPAYRAPAGVVTPLDMVFGFGQSIARGNTYMAHRTGYTARTLGRHLARAGFAQVRSRQGRNFDLWAEAIKAV